MSSQLSSTGHQVNRLSNNGNGATTAAHVFQPLPGVGVTYSPVGEYTIFAGVHQGFAPPTIADAVQIVNGVQSDLGAELSWNYELGVRGTPTKWSGFEFALFQMNFQNQVVSQSLAGGSGATLTNAGRTRHTVTLWQSGGTITVRCCRVRQPSKA